MLHLFYEVLLLGVFDLASGRSVIGVVGTPFRLIFIRWNPFQVNFHSWDPLSG